MINFSAWISGGFRRNIKFAAGAGLLALMIGFFILKEPGNRDLAIAVASNVRFPVTEIKTNFEKETGNQVELIVGSSGKLAAQVEQGAPFDIFISADKKYPRYLHSRKLTANDPMVYAYGKLVLWSLKKDLKGDKAEKILRSANLKKVALPNPETAPYGEVAVEWLKNRGLYRNLREKLVFGENVSQTNHFILSKSVDAGITAKASIYAVEKRKRGDWLEPDPGDYPDIAQAAVILVHGKEHNPNVSEAFFRYLYSPEAARVLKNYDYNLPDKR